MSNAHPSTRKWALSTLASVMPAVSGGQPVIEEIQVFGTPHDQSPAELAQSVTVLQGDTLRRLLGANLGETLAGELGVSSTYFGSGASRPIIRGLAGARVRTMEDSIDSLDVSTISVDHAVGVDPSVAEQIEVFRGPATLLYGSGAVGGVVNTITNRIPESVPEEGIGGSFDVRADTVAEDRTGVIVVDGGRDALAWHFDASRRDSGNYDIPGAAALAHEEEDHEPAEPEAWGYVPNSDFETTSAAFGMSRIGRQGYVGASLSGYETEYGVPGHSRHDAEEATGPGVVEEHQDEGVRIALQQRRLDLKAGWLGVGDAISVIVFRLGVNDYEHAELEDGETGTVFRNDAYEGRLELLHEPWGAWSGAVGLQLSEREFSAVGAEAFVPPVDSASTGLFMLEQRNAGAWDLSLGGRLERVRHTPSDGGASVSDTAASLSAAAIRSLSGDHAFAVNFAIAERVPGAEELFSFGPHLASRTFEIGNRALDVETARHVDIGFRRTEGPVTWAVTAFRTSYDDFIYLADTGLVDADEDLPIFQFLQRDAQFYGLEGEVFAPVAQIGTGELDLRVYADFVDAELDTGENLPRIPPRRLGARLQYHDDRLISGIEAVRYEGQTAVAPYEEPTDGYTLLGVDFSWAFDSGEQTALTLFLKASNLLDDEARKHTSLVKDVAPLPGRNFSIGLRASF